jgi:L-idonate 5-dehydrogenase
LCVNVLFYGSAARFPHVQGAFSELFVAVEEQCFPVPDALSYRAAACAEPLAVALHTVTRAGAVLGRRLLVTGCGPIGVLVVAAARLAGVGEIVVTDVFDQPLQTVKRMGATRVVNVASAPAEMEAFTKNGGWFDTAIEASGNVRALSNSIDSIKRGGRIVQVGYLPPGNPGIPVNRIITKEIDFAGSFRFREEFGWAVEALSGGKIDVEPMLSEAFKFPEVNTAFELASNRQKAMKVSLVA